MKVAYYGYDNVSSPFFRRLSKRRKGRAGTKKECGFRRKRAALRQSTRVRYLIATSYSSAFLRSRRRKN